MPRTSGATATAHRNEFTAIDTMGVLLRFGLGDGDDMAAADGYVCGVKRYGARAVGTGGLAQPTQGPMKTDTNGDGFDLASIRGEIQATAKAARSAAFPERQASRRMGRGTAAGVVAVAAIMIATNAIEYQSSRIFSWVLPGSTLRRTEASFGAGAAFSPAA